MPIDDDTKWLWSVGATYALEGMKTIVLINGVAAISILTFAGNNKTHEVHLIYSLVSFGAGVLMGALTLLSAYLSQLHYGNAGTTSAKENSWQVGSNFHWLTYFCAFLGLLLFAVGIFFAAIGLNVE